jgi:hypothetical protein
MDPLTILLSALALAGKPLSDAAIKDGYAALKETRVIAGVVSS